MAFDGIGPVGGVFDAKLKTGLCLFGESFETAARQPVNEGDLIGSCAQAALANAATLAVTAAIRVSVFMVSSLDGPARCCAVSPRRLA